MCRTVGDLAWLFVESAGSPDVGRGYSAQIRSLLRGRTQILLGILDQVLVTWSCVRAGGLGNGSASSAHRSLRGNMKELRAAQALSYSNRPSTIHRARYRKSMHTAFLEVGQPSRREARFCARGFHTGRFIFSAVRALGSDLLSILATQSDF